MGGGGAEVWVRHPFPQPTSTVSGSGSYAILNPSFTRGAALREVTLGLIAKGAVELTPLPSPGFYSRLFVVWKTSGSWRPVIDLSHLNCFVDVSHFQMETIQSVLLSFRQDDWMASNDLKEAYLQVPVHPDSRPFLRFVSEGHTFQFKALCFGLSTAPQVFSRVMAPISAILHSWGIRMRRYLDDWLVQSSSRESLLRDLQTVLGLCHELGVVINREKSHLIPSQVVQYLGVVINSQSFVASPSPDRISRLQLTAGEFQFSASPPARLWLSLLGMLSSLAHLVPGGRLRMRSLQLCLNRSWDRVDLSAPVSWTGSCLQDLRWWLHLPRLSQGVSLPSLTRPRILVRRLRRRVGSSSGSTGRFRPLDLSTSISVHKCQGIAGHPTWSPPLSVVSTRSYGGSFLRQRHGSGVSPQRGRYQVSYAQHHSPGDPEVGGVPRHSSGSTIHPRLQQRPGGRSVSPSPAPSFRVVPQHDRLSIFVSSVAGPNRFICDLRKSSMFHLFLSLPGSSGGGHGRLPPVLGWSAGLRLPSVCHHSQSPREAPGISGDGAHPSGSALGTAPLVCRSPPAVAGPSGHPSGMYRPPAPASLSAPLW